MTVEAGPRKISVNEDLEAFEGPWRPIGKGEQADPRHIIQMEEGSYIPVRIYGVTPPDRNNGNGQPKAEKKPQVEATAPAEPVIPNQGVIFGDTLIDPGSATLVIPDAPTELPEPAPVNSRASRPVQHWGRYAVGGIHFKGPNRIRGAHLSR